MKLLKNIRIYVLIFLLTAGSVFATEIQGGVSFTVDSAREYVQEGQADNITVSGHAQFENDNTVKKALYSYNNEGDVVGITVLYKNELNKAYIYGPSKQLKYVEKYDKNVDVYPHRGYRYNLDGKLVVTSLTVSKNELFRFSPDGKLIVHSINGVIYDENGNVIGTASDK